MPIAPLVQRDLEISDDGMYAQLVFQVGEPWGLSGCRCLAGYRGHLGEQDGFTDVENPEAGAVLFGWRRRAHPRAIP